MSRFFLVIITMLMTVKASAVDFEIGQVWTYHARSHEKESTLTILKIDEFNDQKIVSIQITQRSVKSDQNPEGNVRVLEHIPIASQALSESVIELLSCGKVPVGYKEGYNIWKEAFDTGRGGYFTIPVVDIVIYIEQTLNS